VRDHFGMCRLAQEAALAALGDAGHLASVIAGVAASRREIARIAGESGLSCVPSATNFVALDCGGDGPFALAVLEELIARDIFVRKPAAPVLDRCIRVSAGPAAEMQAFAEAFPAALSAARTRV